MDKGSHRTVEDILVLGDGDFSFCLSLARRIDQLRVHKLHPTSFRLICTSFDSLEALKSKYSDITSTLSRLSKFTFISIQHGVDATCLKDHFSPQDHQFATIVFNFPHLGSEDCKYHSFFLAHIMNSARPFLVPEYSLLTIALAESQGKVWRINEMALRNNFRPLPPRILNLDEWPGYELKRHQSGKSFKTRVQDCKHFSYTPGKFDVSFANHICDSLSQAPSLLSLPLSSSTDGVDTISPACLRTTAVHKMFTGLKTDAASPPQPQQATKASAVTSLENSASSDAVRLTSAQETETSQPKGKTAAAPRKKRKMDELTAGLYREISATSSAAPVNLQYAGTQGRCWVCNVCGKVFPSQQGARTHTYTMHALNLNSGGCGVGGGSSSSSNSDSNAREGVPIAIMNSKCSSLALNNGSFGDGSAQKESSLTEVDNVASSSSSTRSGDMVDFECSLCGKVVHSREAIIQHRISKHGQYTTVLPTWASTTVSTTSNSNGTCINSNYARKDSTTNIACNNSNNKVIAATLDVGEAMCTSAPVVARAISRSYECIVCGATFSSQASLDRHNNGGFQPGVLDEQGQYMCSVCGREFSQDRAMKQHFNFCKLKAATVTAAASARKLLSTTDTDNAGKVS